MKCLRLILSTVHWGLFLPFLATLGVGPALQSDIENTTAVTQSGNMLQVTPTPTIADEVPATAVTPTPTNAAEVSTATATPMITATVPTATATPTIAAEIPTATATLPVAVETSAFEISLAELGYGERVLHSHYDAIEYTLRLPAGWELYESFFDLDLSYTYSGIGFTETQVVPPLFGDIIVVVDNQTQLVFPIEESALEHFHLRVDLPLSLLNNSANRAHSIEVILDASYICEIPHRARLIIHPTSLFSLAYDQFPVTADLALYPRPFYQRAFEPDQVRFVLPARPSEMELGGAVAVAAKLGDLTSLMVISGTADLALADRLAALEADEPLHEHLIVIGRPESNEIILKLAQLGVLPVPLQERQLDLASEGPAAVVPGGILTYTFTLTNTTRSTLSSLSLVDSLPAGAQVVSCSSLCSEAVEGETSWVISSLEVGETHSYVLELRLSESITDSVLENTVTLLDTAFNPLNVSTLTTTVSSTALPESGMRSSVSSKSRYFFTSGGRAVPENDGIVQELVSPWDQTRGILVITGLNDEAVYKASQAMSFESYFPGMKGPFALVREVRPLPERPPKSRAIDLTFADLGYSDKVMTRFSQETDYYFYIPVNWRLVEGATLDLRFSHSQLFDYNNSFLGLSFNGDPVATISLSDETALNGELNVKLSPSLAHPGQWNRVSIQAAMRPSDECASLDIWLLVSSASLLHLDHKEEDVDLLDLDFYPYPFDQRSDLADVLFVLPPGPYPEEWEEALQLAAVLGDDAGGSDLAPALALWGTRPEAEWTDYHLIAIGRPLRNPVLQRVNAQLPQPFLPGSDEIEQWIDEVVFRLPAGLSLGFVQLIPSPWNEERAFLAVTGTTDEGVRWAVDTLAGRPWVLKGNLTLIGEGGVNTMDTRRLTSNGAALAAATAVPEMMPVAATTVTIAPTPRSAISATPGVTTLEGTPSGSNYPAWLVPLVGLNVFVIIAILAVAFWRARRRRS